MKITLDLSKINKSKINERKYTNKDGVEVTAKEYKLDLVMLKQPKQVAQGDTWTMNKIGFLAEAQTKEERMNKEKSTIVGDVFSFGNEQVEKPDFNKMVDDVMEDMPF